MNTSQLRSAGLHIVTFIGGMTAAVTFMSSHSVDLYAIYDQLNVVIAGISKLLGLVLPLVSAVYAVFKASTKNKIEDVIADPKAPEIAKEIPVTPAAVAVGNALKEKP